MKNFNLNDLDVEEMSVEELTKENGGIIGVDDAVAFLVGSFIYDSISNFGSTSSSFARGWSSVN